MWAERLFARVAIQNARNNHSYYVKFHSPPPPPPKKKQKKNTKLLAKLYWPWSTDQQEIDVNFRCSDMPHSCYKNF